MQMYRSTDVQVARFLAESGKIFWGIVLTLLRTDDILYYISSTQPTEQAMFNITIARKTIRNAFMVSEHEVIETVTLTNVTTEQARNYPGFVRFISHAPATPVSVDAVRSAGRLD